MGSPSHYVLNGLDHHWANPTPKKSQSIFQMVQGHHIDPSPKSPLSKGRAVTTDTTIVATNVDTAIVSGRGARCEQAAQHKLVSL